MSKLGFWFLLGGMGVLSVLSGCTPATPALGPEYSACRYILEEKAFLANGKPRFNKPVIFVGIGSVNHPEDPDSMFLKQLGRVWPVKPASQATAFDFPEHTVVYERATGKIGWLIWVERPRYLKDGEASLRGGAYANPLAYEIYEFRIVREDSVWRVLSAVRVGRG